MNRRTFLHAAAIPVWTAASYKRVLGANGRLGLGLIGAGRRGMLVASAFQQDERVDLRSICDVHDVHRQHAQATLKAQAAGLTGAHEEVLGNRDVDAVLIATPDHLHVSIAQAALEQENTSIWRSRLSIGGRSGVR